MKSILVLGLGRFGRHLANKLQQLGNEVMVIDKDEALVEKYSNTFTDAQIGDCTDEAVIRSLGVNQFDVCFVTICDDFQSSLVTTSLVKKMGARHVVAKAKRDIQAEFLKKIGANEVIILTTFSIILNLQANIRFMKFLFFRNGQEKIFLNSISGKNTA